jgi:hypothetical protein
VAERLTQFESTGVDLVLLQFSPQLEEMERFAQTVIRRNSSVPAWRLGAENNDHR